MIKRFICSASFLIITLIFFVSPRNHSLVNAQTSQSPCFGIANQGVAARIKGTNRLIAGATISSTRDAGAVTCTWGGQTVSSSGSCITGGDGLCEINPLNCGSSTGSLFTYRGSHPDYICEDTKHTTVNNRDNSVAIVECEPPPERPVESPPPGPSPSPTLYSISGSLRSCTLEASGWTDAALTASPTISIDNTSRTTTGSSYSFAGLVSGGYTLRAGEVSGYTGPLESCSSQTATTTMGFTLGPSLVKNLYFKQISTTPPPPDVCPAPTCTNTSGQTVSVGGTQTCSTCGGTQTCQASGCTASWSTCSIPQTSCTQTGTFNCYVGTATNITASSADVTVTTSGDGSTWDRINWYLNDQFQDTTVGTPGTSNRRTFSNLANNTAYTVKAQFYKNADTSQNVWCSGTPQFTTGTQQSTSGTGTLKCLSCGDRWYWAYSCTQRRDFCSSTACTERTDPNQPARNLEYCWIAQPEPYQPLTGDIDGGLYIRQPGGSESLASATTFPHMFYWIYAKEGTGRPLSPINAGGLNLTALNAQNQYYSGASSSMGVTGTGGALDRDFFQIHSWGSQYDAIGYYTYQESKERNPRDVPLDSPNGTCEDPNGSSATACRTYGCITCGSVSCIPSGCSGLLTRHENDGYECKPIPRSAFTPWTPPNGFISIPLSIPFCMPGSYDGTRPGDIGFTAHARIDLVFALKPNPTCIGGSWLTTRTGSSSYSNISLAINPYDKIVTQAFYAIRRDTSGYTDWIPALYSSNRAHTGPVDFGSFGTPADWSIKFKVIWSGGESTTEGTCPFPSQAYSWLEAKGADAHANGDLGNSKVASGKFFLFDPASAGSAHNGQVSAQTLNIPSDRVRFASNVSTITYSGIQFPQLDYEFLETNAKPWDGSSAVSHPGIATYQGDLTLTTPPTLTRTGPGITVVLVNGNLTINGSSGSFRHTFGSPKDGIVYLVRGNIQFASTLNSANGVYIADGNAQGRGGTITSVYGTSTAPLVIDGMLYARSDILLNRQLATSQASESVRYQSNYALFPSFLEGITKPVVTWEEVAPPTEPIVVSATGTSSAAPATQIAYWNMNEGSGTVMYDTVGGNDGYLKNGTTWVTDGSIKALQFDGVDDHVVVPDSSDLDFVKGDEISISAWIYPKNLSTRQILVLKQEQVALNYMLALNGYDKAGSLDFSYISLDTNTSGSANVWQTNYTLPAANVWYYVVLTYRFGDGASIKLYVNGIQRDGRWTGGTGNQSPTTTGSTLSISALYPYAGFIDELQLHRRMLTSQEVSNLYVSAR